MFTEGIESILSIQDKIPKGYRFFGEYLNKPKHNVLKYNRVPDKNVILWDVFDNYRMSHCLWAPDMKEFIRNMGLEIVPILYKGNPPIDLEASFNLFSPFLSSESCLGGQKVEGIVVKTIGQTRYLGKFVNSSFKEVHCKRKSNELQSIRREGILPSLIRELKTESRWVKAVQHLRENGSLNGDLSDIKNICKEIGGDVKCEEGDYIKRQLFKWAWPEISKGILKGVPEWYKESLSLIHISEPTRPY